MLGSVATCAIVAIEVAMVAYQLNRQGVFTELRNKFTKQVRDTAENVSQPILKRIGHARYS